MEKIFLRLQLSFPGVLDRQQVGDLVGHSYLDGLLGRAQVILSDVLHTGLIEPESYPSHLFGADSIELWRWLDGKLEREVLPLERMLTRQNLPFLLRGRLTGQAEESVELTSALVGAFAAENAFLDAEQTEKHRQKAVTEVEPVEGKLFRGQIIVRRGDIISEEAAARIQAVGAYASSVNFNSIAGTALHLLLVFCLAVVLLGPAVTRVRLRTAQVLYLSVSGAVYLLLAGLLTTIDSVPHWLPLSTVLPTGAFTILIAMLISPLVAILYSAVLSAALLPLVGMDVFSFLFAFITGVVGTAVVRQAERGST